MTKCKVRFEDDPPGRTYTVPDYALIDLHEYLLNSRKSGKEA